METAYDAERHKALHFEQATELKDQHIANLEGARGRPAPPGRRAGPSALAALEAQVQELEGANEALRDELRTLHQDGRAAAGNLLAVAKRGLSGGRPGPRPAGRLSPRRPPPGGRRATIRSGARRGARQNSTRG